jgi:hypothetical protein
MSDIIPSTDPAILAYFETKRKRIILKTRLNEMDSMIRNPTEEELDASILDAMDSFNVVKPFSNYTVTDIYNAVASGDATLDHCILIGSCYHIMLTVWNDWGHSGDGINLSILSEPDRMNRIKELMDAFEEDFLKKSRDYKFSNAVRVSSSPYNSTSRTIGYGKSRGLRRGYKSPYRSC